MQSNSFYVKAILHRLYHSSPNEENNPSLPSFKVRRAPYIDKGIGLLTDTLKNDDNLAQSLVKKTIPTLSI